MSIALDLRLFEEALSRATIGKAGILGFEIG
jgi:hypothetical protein